MESRLTPQMTKMGKHENRLSQPPHRGGVTHLTRTLSTMNHIRGTEKYDDLNLVMNDVKLVVNYRLFIIIKVYRTTNYTMIMTMTIVFEE